MNWSIQALRSSIGKKMRMAITGLGFCSSLLAHSACNLTNYKGLK
jgi:succinate dehydrogenase / fumarate reductase cytochrome b subunit